MSNPSTLLPSLAALLHFFLARLLTSLLLLFHPFRSHSCTHVPLGLLPSPLLTFQPTPSPHIPRLNSCSSSLAHAVTPILFLTPLLPLSVPSLSHSPASMTHHPTYFFSSLSQTSHVIYLFLIPALCTPSHILLIQPPPLFTSPSFLSYLVFPCPCFSSPATLYASCGEYLCRLYRNWTLELPSAVTRNLGRIVSLPVRKKSNAWVHREEYWYARHQESCCLCLVRSRHYHTLRLLLHAPSINS